MTSTIAYSIADEMARRIVDEARQLDRLNVAIYTHGTLDCLIHKHQSSPVGVVNYQSAEWRDSKATLLPSLRVRCKEALSALVAGPMRMDDMNMTNLEYWSVRYIVFTGSTTPPDRLRVFEDIPGSIQSGYYDREGDDELGEDEPPADSTLVGKLSIVVDIAWDIMKA